MCFGRVQLTEETLGTSEKTELDAHFEHLVERANATKAFTEKILRNMEVVLRPNPGEINLITKNIIQINDLFISKIFFISVYIKM